MAISFFIPIGILLALIGLILLLVTKRTKIAIAMLGGGLLLAAAVIAAISVMVQAM